MVEGWTQLQRINNKQQQQVCPMVFIDTTQCHRPSQSQPQVPAALAGVVQFSCYAKIHPPLPKVLHLVSETFLKVVTKCIFQELNYFFSSQSIMSYPSQALHIKLFSSCSLRQLVGIKIALRQILEKQLKAWCLGDFCNYELIMVWPWKDLCLRH